MPYLVAKHKNPPGGGFPYTHPVTHQHFFSFPWVGLLEQVFNHERANGIPTRGERPVELWEREIEVLVCEELRATNEVAFTRACSEEASIGQMAVNLASAAGRLVKAAVSGQPWLPSKALAQQRFDDHCSKCPHWQGWSHFLHWGKCRLCGCTRVKLGLPSEYCTDNPPRWTAVT